MTDKKQKSEPVYGAFAVKQISKDKNHYTRIGAVYEIMGGKGLAVNLDALPLQGRILLFKEDGAQKQE